MVFFSVERVHKRHIAGRRAVSDKLYAQQARQRADLAVGPPRLRAA